MTTTVREARPEEAADVAALVRDGYLAYAGAVPPDLLCTWIDDVVDAGGGVTFVASSTARSREPRGCTSAPRTRCRCPLGARASAPSWWRRPTAGPAWAAC